MSRRVLIAGNWKMHLRRPEVVGFCQRLRDASLRDEPEVALFPPFPFLQTLEGALGDTPVSWGGQDLHAEDSGAHTGDTSGLHQLDFGATRVLCGHSERRADHGESDDHVAAKVASALRQGLEPVLCLGESREQRESGDTEAVLERQLTAALPRDAEPGRWVLAYEPVWAIGSGLTATPEIAQQAHAFLRSKVEELADTSVADRLQILYGGSVKPANCEELLACPDIDGFLIGGASLDPDSFLDIIRRCGATGPSV